LGLITLRYAGLFNLPIPLRYAFGIGVSTIKGTGAFDFKTELAGIMRIFKLAKK
jgi:hypothetical protein